MNHGEQWPLCLSCFIFACESEVDLVIKYGWSVCVVLSRRQIVLQKLERHVKPLKPVRFHMFCFSGVFDFGIAAACHRGYRGCIHICVSIQNVFCVPPCPLVFLYPYVSWLTFLLPLTASLSNTLSRETRLSTGLRSKSPSTSFANSVFYLRSPNVKLDNMNVLVSSAVYFITHIVLVCCKGPRWVCRLILRRSAKNIFK